MNNGANVIEIDGLTYTHVDQYSAIDQNGGEWDKRERRDMVSVIRWAEREMKIWGPKVGNGMDEAACYMQALEIRNSAEESIRVVDLLWPR